MIDDDDEDDVTFSMSLIRKNVWNFDELIFTSLSDTTPFGQPKLTHISFRFRKKFCSSKKMCRSASVYE